MNRFWLAPVVVSAGFACACSEDSHRYRGPCARVHHAELDMARNPDPTAEQIPFNQAEFVADRTTRFDFKCDLVSGGTSRTECATDGKRFTISYDDAGPIGEVTLRVFDRFGELRLEASDWSSSTNNIFDDCPGDAASFFVPFVIDPPGLPPDAGPDGAADASGADGADANDDAPPDGAIDAESD